MKSPPANHQQPQVNEPPSSEFDTKYWPKIGGRPGCFFCQLTLPKADNLGPLAGAGLFLFGGFEQSSYKGTPVKEPHFAVVEQRDGRGPVKVHDLYQDDDVFYSSKTEHARLAKLPPRDPSAHFEDPVWKARFEIKTDAFGVLHDALKTGDICPELEEKVCADYEQAGKPNPRKKWLKERLLPEYRSLRARPRWVEDEGEWPAFMGRQMFFLGQFGVPENDRSHEYCLAGKMVYLFAGWVGKQAEFKILSQDSGVQTAEDHYRAEEIMARYLQAPRDPKTIQQCAKDGDQYVHEFLLAQPGLPANALKLLSEKGANKTIRDEAKRRMKA